MLFEKLILCREACRNFRSEPIKREYLDKIANAGRLAPSSCNHQPWKFIIVDQPSLVSEVAECTLDRDTGTNVFTDSAQAFIVIVEEPGHTNMVVRETIRTGINYNVTDMSIAAAFMSLQAADLGIGSLIIGFFKENSIKKLLGINEERKIHLVLGLGWPVRTNPRKKVRMPFNEIVCHNVYCTSPEISNIYYRISDNCIHCGLCVQTCPKQTITNTGEAIVINPSNCMACGACLGVCPVGAPEEIIEYA